MCGLVGIVGHEPVNQSIYDALTVLQHRGQDAAGIMTDDERDRALYSGFELGLRVMMDAHDMQLPATAAEKPWNLLQEIADGSTTIVQSKGDWVAGHRKSIQRSNVCSTSTAEG